MLAEAKAMVEKRTEEKEKRRLDLKEIRKNGKQNKLANLRGMSLEVLWFTFIHGDQLTMAVFRVSWKKCLVQCTVYTCTVGYTGQVTFYKVPEKRGHV